MAENMPEVIVESLASHAIAKAAQLVRTIVTEAVQQRKTCSIALAGGTTPHSLYKHLAGEAIRGEIPWSQTDVFFGDERDVAHDDVASNYNMAQRTLLDHLPIQPDRIHPMPADADDLDAAAEGYERLIRDRVPAGPGGIPRMDLILLGMGTDGHTASLFPGTGDALDESEKLVLSHFVPVLGRSRMTFTFPLINAARNVLLFVLGQDKAETVAAILSSQRGTRREIPAGRIAPVDGRFIVLLDGDAAGKLQTPAK